MNNLRIQSSGTRLARRGFSTVELLVVIAIIAILLVLLLPAVQFAREAMRRTSCASNLRQLGLSLHQYHEVQGKFPMGETHGLTGGTATGYRFGPHCYWDGFIGCWITAILPQMEASVEYDQLDFETEPQWSVPANVTVMQTKFPFIVCPSDPYHDLTTPWRVDENRARIMHYYAVAGSLENSNKPHPDGTLLYSHCNANDGMFYNDSTASFTKIKDGTTYTAMLCEVWGRTNIGYSESRGMNLHSQVYFDWTPNSFRLNPWHANSFHPGGVNIVFADGALHFIGDDIDLATFQGMATIHGREPLDGAKTGF